MERLLVKLKNEIRLMEDTVFNNPPQNYDEYRERLGRWKGLGQAVDIIEREILDAREVEERS